MNVKALSYIDVRDLGFDENVIDSVLSTYINYDDVSGENCDLEFALINHKTFLRGVDEYLDEIEEEIDNPLNEEENQKAYDILCTSDNFYTNDGAEILIKINIL